MESRKRTVHQFACSSLSIHSNLQLPQKAVGSAKRQISEQRGHVPPRVDMSLNRQSKNIKTLALSCRQTLQKTANSQEDTDLSEGQQTPRFALSQRLDLHDKQKMLEFDDFSLRYDMEHSQKVRVYRQNKLVPECDWLEFFFREQEDSSSESDLTSIWLGNDEDIENTAYLDHEEEFEIASEPSQPDQEGSEVSNCSTEAPQPSDFDTELDTPPRDRRSLQIQRI